MASNCSHQDQERKGVSSTAHGVASLRAYENNRGDDALFKDPYADLMGGEVGRDFLNSPRMLDNESATGLIDSMAVRTRKIDDEIYLGIRELGLRQICVLGAGLDTRAWRLSVSADESILYFEVDFPEIFDYKLPLLKEAGAVSPFQYHNVIADLSLADWYLTLLSSGFDKHKPTLWVLEGLLNYLTEDEAVVMFNKITTQLSAKGSRMITTCMTPRTKSGTTWHRFYPEDPLTWLNAQGWTGTQTEIIALGEQYGRPITDKTKEGYYIAVVDIA